ncbi:hypothetical protein [Pseudarthrobacter sp. J47]|uniref:hypothetical protein n=1 Tax=Pseudarthrobacter sp. J47 TaxID=3116482 RepID=UPI002E80FBAB|nr:hypothetical protein [Pseudarthrobacter sp. J47]MEE2524501.1 hypothetical protein [Pseudarthrobacter sp. J47]
MAQDVLAREDVMASFGKSELFNQDRLAAMAQDVLAREDVMASFGKSELFNQDRLAAMAQDVLAREDVMASFGKSELFNQDRLAAMAQDVLAREDVMASFGKSELLNQDWSGFIEKALANESWVQLAEKALANESWVQLAEKALANESWVQLAEKALANQDLKGTGPELSLIMPFGYARSVRTALQIVATLVVMAVIFGVAILGGPIGAVLAALGTPKATETWKATGKAYDSIYSEQNYHPGKALDRRQPPTTGPRNPHDKW